MLRIGERIYELVQSQSGFRVILDPSETDDFWQQRWLFDAHYVPAAGDPGPPAGALWEYQRILINPLWLSISHWHDLTTYHPVDHGVNGFYPFAASLENLLQSRASHDEDNRIIYPDEFRVLRREGYLFHCEFEGAVNSQKEEPSGEQDEKSAEPAAAEFQLRDEIPFTDVTVRVPINSTDPLAAARAIAARELGLTSIGRSHLRPYNPTPRRHFRTLGTDKHTVLLETPWRDQSS